MRRRITRYIKNSWGQRWHSSDRWTTLIISLLVARFQRPCLSSPGDFGPPGAKTNVPPQEQSASYPLYMYFTKDGPHSGVFKNWKPKRDNRIEGAIYSPFCHTLLKLTNSIKVVLCSFVLLFGLQSSFRDGQYFHRGVLDLVPWVLLVTAAK